MSQWEINSGNEQATCAIELIKPDFASASDRWKMCKNIYKFTYANILIFIEIIVL